MNALKYQHANLRQSEDPACPNAPSDTVQVEKMYVTHRSKCSHDGGLSLEMVHSIPLVS
jgi:hypothetical protein